MANDKQPTTIKKYANRRLYNTGTSAYVTLEDLAEMVKRGEDFVVYDAKTGEEITRSVLTQIIFEQEGKNGQSLLPVAFLRQLIRFYGDSIQMLVPSYLEFTIDKLTNDPHKFREQFDNALGVSPLTAPTRQMFGSLEEQTRKNMALFSQALTMFSPFSGAKQPLTGTEQPAAEGGTKPDLDEMKRQLDELQQRLEKLTPKE
ncbi:polyhydroxyalkanoate synthesis repressor PhaR [Methylovirgula ligni]|uniref:Polyhydroxyalkanoate synthesis repressor PhaR n=1 Tax=Methylovirgula ligni TaxID=569860 RepID=A0A3D9YZY8_9HYPH|nr:polyhydroxyalkanoate synthesis repressor PhaR [Methylovirgula ligni]QAY95888.1 polyhydroxyalkanoate synthesis repressor PhaR [Methylovirgula ligni]REF86462.1 polyhydroxyalkanoate synthesis repressor PhaR [Methylovirgula ligni]